MKRWWVNKYKLPPTHPTFQSYTVAELKLEMFQDLIARRRELRDLQEEKGYDPEKLQEQINAINEVFGDKEEIWDPLVDKWERELLEGRVPDLDEPVGEDDGES